MATSPDAIWQSKKSFLQGAWDGGQLTAVPVEVQIRTDGLTITRWYPVLWILFGFGVIPIYRVLTTPRQAELPAACISSVEIVKGWVDNPLSRRRFENNKPLYFKVKVAESDGRERKLRLMLTKESLGRLQAVPWIGTVAAL